MSERIEIKLGNENLTIETGKLAKQASASVTVQYGETVVLVAVVMSKEPRVGLDFFPLTVEYKEKTYAAGKIPGGFFKREGRPTEKEILTSRLIDRPIRPLFPKGMYNEVQIVAMVLASDGKNDPDTLAMIGTSAALSISDIPFAGPLGVVKVGRINDEFIINPTYEQLQESSMELVLAGTKTGIVMIESGCKQVSEELMLEAMKVGYEKIKKVIAMQEEFVAKCGKPKAEVVLSMLAEDLVSKVKELSLTKLTEIYKLKVKEERQGQLSDLLKEIIAEVVTEDSPFTESEVKAALGKIEKEFIRKSTIASKTRVDGRGLTDIREITCEVGALPRTHGAAVFTRGQTQSLAVTTLGTGSDEQKIEDLSGSSYKNFMLHYNFPPFSVGEARPMRGTSRREIGHGALAERALSPVMPATEDFPYTVR